MATTPTAITLTPTWDSKRLTIEGNAAVREQVQLRLVGCANDTSIVVKVSSENGRVDYAKFPNSPSDVWTEDGDDLTAVLSLNTVALIAAFAPWGPDDRLNFVWTVASRTNSNLYAKGCKQLGNWMEDTDDPVAYSTPLADDIDAAQEDIAALESAFGAHSHTGATGHGPVLAHSGLSGKGVNSHDAIDAALVTLNSSASTNHSNILEVAARVTALEGDYVSEDAFAAVTALGSNATGKQILAKVNEILTILKG